MRGRRTIAVGFTSLLLFAVAPACDNDKGGGKDNDSVEQEDLELDDDEKNE
ncbi:MAG: hypothetical protein M3345_00280 [Actinomycetota bacterium]|nr:hypothetical protein [Actinomycetota bacterium]